MSMISEFKEFAMKGNVMDMAVGIIIGGAFGKIISSLVNDIIMPVVGKLLGGVDFSGLFLNLGEGDFSTLAAAREAGAATLNYGSFIQTAIDFLIIAFAIFMMIKAMNSVRKVDEEAPAEPPAEQVLLSEIRDLLKK